MSTDSRTTSRCRAVRPAVRSCFTAVIGVLLLAVLTNTAAAHEGDRWPEHGSGRIGSADRGGKGRPHNFKRGYIRGYADAYDHGYRQGRWKRATYRRWHRAGPGWRNRSVYIRWHF